MGRQILPSVHANRWRKVGEKMKNPGCLRHSGLNSWHPTRPSSRSQLGPIKEILFLGQPLQLAGHSRNLLPFALALPIRRQPKGHGQSAHWLLATFLSRSHSPLPAPGNLCPRGARDLNARRMKSNWSQFCGSAEACNPRQSRNMVRHTAVIVATVWLVSTLGPAREVRQAFRPGSCLPLVTGVLGVVFQLRTEVAIG